MGRLKEKEICPIIMNFTDVYKNAKFCEDISAKWLEVSKLQGTNCYCDEEAQKNLYAIMQKEDVFGIHFIDSGNYHYVSRLWLTYLEEPFVLIVFDNHTDMQPPAFGGLLSCGGWIASAVEELEYLKKVILIGPDEEAFSKVEKHIKEKTLFLSREQLRERTKEEKLTFLQNISEGLPIYISVDKDVLNEEAATTTWSQGDLSLEELKDFLIEMKQLYGDRILGLDICGEAEDVEKNQKNDKANGEILQIFSTF